MTFQDRKTSVAQLAGEFRQSGPLAGETANSGSSLSEFLDALREARESEDFSAERAEIIASNKISLD